MFRHASRVLARPLWHAALLGTLIGCHSLAPTFTPRGANGRTADDAGGRTGPAGYGGRTLIGRDSADISRPRDPAGRSAMARGDLTSRRQCRSAGVPADWVAVAYEAANAGCPSRATVIHDSVATVEVIVRYGNAPVGTILDVCADQRIPSGWTRVLDEAPENSDACPGASRNGVPSAIRIRRVA